MAHVVDGVDARGVPAIGACGGRFDPQDDQAADDEGQRHRHRLEQVRP
jgi:hypothetical protein